MLAKLMGYFLLGLTRLLTGAQARWHGCPPKAEQRIYFAHHQSHVDLRHVIRAIAAKDYWTKTPFRRWLTTAVFNVVYVSRERSRDEDPLAQRFPQVVLVPAWINNVQHVLPKGEVVPVPVLCSVTFGAPLQLEPEEDRHRFLDRARKAVIALREV